MHKHKEFQQKPPTQTPPRGALDPPKFFMHGASLPFKIQGKPMHKEFQGGGLRVPQILYALVLCVFYCCLIKGRFRKGWFWRMYPRSGFRSGGTCERTLVPVCLPGEHPNVPSFRFSFRGNIRQNHPFGNLLGSSESRSCNNTLLRRVLRRFSNSKCFLEGFLEGLSLSLALFG